MEVKLENLSKVFPGSKNRPATVAVNNMDLTIPDGKLVGLLGPSGCGKSTTLYMIAWLHKATEGKIYFGELNTIPGFTEISMFPKLFIHDGYTYTEILDILIKSAKKKFK